MSEMRYKKSEKSKLPLIILIVVLVLVIAAIVFVIISMNSSPKQSQTASTEPSSAAQTTLNPESSDSVTAQPAQDSTGEGKADSQTSQKVVVPALSGDGEGEFFNASFTPTRAVDSLTGNSATLKEVFGTSYSGGAYTFNDDGTFSESISLTSVFSGAYAVQGDTLAVTYTNDKNIFFEISKRDGDAPSELILKDYGGYDIYLTEG